MTEEPIRLRAEPANMTTVAVGGVLLYFSYLTLVGFRCPRLGTVVNPEGRAKSKTTAAHMTHFGLNAPGTGQCSTEEDFQTLAMGAVMGSSGPDHLLLN
ncbi:hypothetical protein CcrC1_gp522 [Caulobacter phage C1]|nr:hypothetical protein CcrC1_gp029 [Caulobacter phage C1]UTU08256.1 hypothetical protein CcrC2_gp028 [Caulobacter phage C2]UTU09315.1 hypothetical protein CcrBL47_gp029 [Caulobacter phage BL47]UTU09891.1 hypothetical protein CcrRB23_gp029 [Caulobacter phage RB23]WGN96915.1 hypothetical protein [Bertelyvirus sp.]